jgi:LysM repeat protein
VFQPTITPRPITPVPPAPVIGQHLVLGGETIFCIARGYGVLPAAISRANNLSATATVRAGQVLNIPQVQWVNIQPGPVCATQFPSPFPGLVVPTATTAATQTPAGPPLSVALDLLCVGDNCGSREGFYTVRVTVRASGGVEPYTYDPGPVFDVNVPHCTSGAGTVTVTSADGQVVSRSWTFEDVSCRP